MTTPNAAEVAPPSPQPPVRLVHVELRNYRRLRAVRLDLDDETTVMVGSNNTGKTSVMQAIDRFVNNACKKSATSGDFAAHDISADGWASLMALGRKWEAETGTADGNEETREDEEQEMQALREAQLEELLSTMPFIDLWFDAADGAWHLVRDLIPTLDWNGGLVGLRLRLEPVSNLEELDRLVSAYKHASSSAGPSKGEAGSSNSSRAWPTDLFDFLIDRPHWLAGTRGTRRVRAWRLDPDKLRSPHAGEVARPQDLNARSRALPEVAALLSSLICVDYVPAQRGLSDTKTVGLLSQQVVGFANEVLKQPAEQADSNSSEAHQVFAAALENVHYTLDTALNQALDEHIRDLRSMGYPTVRDLKDLKVRSRVKPHEALHHHAALQYRSEDGQEDAQHLPEQAIGLGYQNLLALTFRLMQSREARLRGPSNTSGPSSPAPVHLVLLEEPEAHLHVQVQRSFIQSARDRVTPRDHPELATQVLVSTHSSHLAHAVDFSRLRYLRRRSCDALGPLPTSVIVSLRALFAGLKGATSKTDKDLSVKERRDRENLRFVQRYLRVHHHDLLFADAVIVVEGSAEEVLVPSFIQRDHEALSSAYLSILPIGGSHAHRFRRLVELLGLPTLIVTDLDPVAPQEKGNAKACPAVRGQGLETANSTLKSWIPERKSIDELLNLDDDDKVRVSVDQGSSIRVAFQFPPEDGAQCPSSFEDALVLENIEWFRALPEDDNHVTVRKMRELASDCQDEELGKALHDALRSSFDKAAFAIDLFLLLGESKEGGSLTCPRYVREGLTWLAEQLGDDGGGDAGRH